MHDHSDADELREGMKAARSYKFERTPHTTPVKLISHIEDALETAFDAALAGKNPKKETTLREAEKEFHVRLNVLVRTQIREMKQLRPLEDMEEAVDRFLRSVDGLRVLLPKDAIPDPWTMRDQTRFMLIGMENGLLYNEEILEEKMGRLHTHLDRDRASWRDVLNTVNPRVEPVALLPKPSLMDPILYAGRHRAAQIVLDTIPFHGAVAQAWVDTLQHAADLARSQLRLSGQQVLIGHIDEQFKVLEQNMKEFGDAATTDKGGPDGLEIMRQHYQDIANTVETLSNLLPKNLREKIPARDQFADQEDGVLQNVRNAVANVRPRTSRDSGGAGHPGGGR